MASSENSQSIEQRSLQVGKWANLFMCGSGIVAAYASHSDALLVDGLYSGVNFISAILAAKVSESVMLPADRRFPFGYDAYEPLYIKYRALVLLGIIVYAMFGAGSKIITYATGGDVPTLVFGPIVAYTALMLAICFGLAFWHRYNWQRSGERSELLKTETKAALVDGVISAGAGGGLLGATLLGNTPLKVVVPVADSIIVLVMSAFIVKQPFSMFTQALREVAGGAADADVVQRAQSATVEILDGKPFKLLELIVTKMGRSYLIVPYVQPDCETSADAIDALRLRLMDVYQGLLGQVKVEVIVTNESPFSTNDASHHVSG